MAAKKGSKAGRAGKAGKGSRSSKGASEGGASRAAMSRVNDAFVAWGGPRIALGLALAGAVAAGLLFGVSHLESRASAMIAVPADEVTFAWPVVRRIPGAQAGEGGAVQWPPRDVQERLLELAHARVSRHADPLSAAALEAIGRDLRASGLFESIGGVLRRSPDRIEVRGRWRLPAAAVRHEGRDHLVGPGAELLPVRYEPGREAFRVVLGAAFNPPTREGGSPAHGRAWPGEDVPAALSVLALLRDKSYWHQVRAIDVSGHALDGTLEIVTDRGTRVDWGAAPGEFKPGEVDTRTKLEHLGALYARFGRIDAGKERVTIFYEYTDVDRSASGGR